MKKLVEIWKELGKSIYTGKRLKANLLALTLVSIVCIVIGLALTIVNAVKGSMMVIPAIATLVAGIACALCAGVFKKRGIAAAIPTVFCSVAFIVYVFTGAGNGTALLFSLLMPIGLSYFANVKIGIILSAFYSILYSVLFFTPLKELFTQFYSPDFMLRFSIVFIGTSFFTWIAMIQYHRATLFEIEHTNRLNEEVEKQTRVATERAEKLEHITEEIVQTLALVIDAKDKYTNGHSFRVAEYSVAIAKKLGWSDERLSELEWQGLMHDIGKIGIPDQVLNKPGRLTAEEFEVIKSHAAIGGDILEKSSELAFATDAARYHHERYDGKGYPTGLAGEEIPLIARVISIADAFDAMHSDRIYRKGLPLEVIRSEFVKGRGTQFDPGLVDVFIGMLDNGEV